MRACEGRLDREARVEPELFRKLDVRTHDPDRRLLEQLPDDGRRGVRRRDAERAPEIEERVVPIEQPDGRLGRRQPVVPDTVAERSLALIGVLVARRRTAGGQEGGAGDEDGHESESTSSRHAPDIATFVPRTYRHLHPARSTISTTWKPTRRGDDPRARPGRDSDHPPRSHPGEKLASVVHPRRATPSSSAQPAASEARASSRARGLSLAAR